MLSFKKFIYGLDKSYFLIDSARGYKREFTVHSLNNKIVNFHLNFDFGLFVKIEDKHINLACYSVCGKSQNTYIYENPLLRKIN